MPHQPFADLVPGVEDVDRHQLRLGLVGAAVPEDLPHLFGGGVELDLVVVFLHAAQRRTPPGSAATVARVTTKLPIIDADGHVMEPFDLWDERLPEEYRDRAGSGSRRADGEQVSFLGHATGLRVDGRLAVHAGRARRRTADCDRDLDTDVDPARATRCVGSS